MEITFQTKTILITGAAGQLGHAVAQGYSASGAQRLLLLDKPEQRAALEAQAQELEGRYPTCAVHVYCADLVETAQIQAAAEAIRQDGFGVDVLVNIAGMNFLEKAVDVKEEVWDYLMDLNLKGSFFLTQQVAQDSLLDRGGNVIFIASQHAVVGNHMRAAYCASKSGLRRPCEYRLAHLHPQRQKSGRAPQRQLQAEILAAHPSQALRPAGGRGQRHPVPLQRPGVYDHRPQLDGRRRLYRCLR